MRIRSVALSVLFGVPFVARAADIPASYLVQQKPLKAAIAGTALSFQLFTDAACTAPPAQSVTVPIESVTVISKLSPLVPKGAAKGPAVAELRTTLAGVTATGNLWLQVTGTGVTPVGGACQAQSGHVAEAASGPGALATKTVVLFPSDISSQWSIETPADVGGLPPGTNIAVIAVERQAALTMQGLDNTTRYSCNIELVSPVAPSFATNMIPVSTTTYLPIFGLSSCTPACSDGVRDGKETDVDCGGETGCARCPAGDRCQSGGDCASGQCVFCRFCLVPLCQ